MTRKSYSVEFKQQAVQLALSGEKSKARTATDPGVPESKLHAWIATYGPAAPPPAAGVTVENARPGHGAVIEDSLYPFCGLDEKKVQNGQRR